jgi:hypothetical protein
LKSLGVRTVLIDGAHRFDHVVNDIYLALDLLDGTDDGYIYLDDTNTRDVALAASYSTIIFKEFIVESHPVGKGGVVFRVKGNRQNLPSSYPAVVS